MWHSQYHRPKVNVKSMTTILMIIDTGAFTDNMDENDFPEANHMNNLELLPTTKCIFGYGSDSQLTDLKCAKSVVHVILGNHGSFLRYSTACNASLAHDKIKHVGDCPHVCDMLIQKYPTIFDNIGTQGMLKSHCTLTQISLW